MSAIIYDFKTKKRISSGNDYRLKEYCLRVIYECPNGHLYAEEYDGKLISLHGLDKCLKDSIKMNEKRSCPKCDEELKVQFNNQEEPK